jgi:membrane protein insertase Oxa1/YidC/SpoIIIJ
MNFKNEKLKIYSIGIPLFGLFIIILGVLVYITYSNILSIIQEILLSFILGLLGIKQVMTQRNKAGYLMIFVSLANILVVVNRVYIIFKYH